MITQTDIIYFVMTDRFFDGEVSNDFEVDKKNPRFFHGGDLNRILQKADYNLNLGATAVWITPVYVNTEGFADSKPYHYYWPKDFDKVDKRLHVSGNYPEGSMYYLADFVTKMHEKGLKVILDVVINHGGYDIKQETKFFDESWYNENGTNHEKRSLYGLPDFDNDNINVVHYFINNLMNWVEISGINGFRMDTAYHVEKKFW
jgi:glycosidase